MASCPTVCEFYIISLRRVKTIMKVLRACLVECNPAKGWEDDPLRSTLRLDLALGAGRERQSGFRGGIAAIQLERDLLLRQIQHRDQTLNPIAAAVRQDIVIHVD